MSRFVHLHLHTQYSVLDGAIKISELVKRASECGHKAVAITDHGVMHGAVEFYQAAKNAGIRPIVGCEAYITSGSRHDKRQAQQGGPSTHHLTLLAQNPKGYQNLCKLVSLGFLEGYYYRPRIDFELLSELNEGLICFSGCLSSQLASCSKRDDIESAQALVEQYASVFGDRYYLEVQPHSVPEQQQLNQLCRELGQKLGLPLVATNDAHYLCEGDNHAHEVLMCVSTGKLLSDEDRMRHEGADLFFKNESEMLAELPGFEDAIFRTSEIAERCDLEFDFANYHMPKFAPPDDISLDDFFASEARAGLKERIDESAGAEAITEDLFPSYEERLDEEIALIWKMGFSGYFLVVSDFIRWAKKKDIPVGPGRGSAAGSLVAWALRITEVDPIRHKLLFERFLNPERVSLPDIDVDFCINGRDDVIEYVREKYGKDKVAQICTFGTLKAKAAIKDVGRVLGLSYAETDRVAKLIPAPRQGFDYPIAEALKMEKRLREYANGEGRELIELAQKLEGLSRHTSTHAAGLVIADRPVMDLLPLMLDKDQQVVTQFSMGYVEKIGLVKFDFLGLKTLTVIDAAVQMIRATTGKEIDVNQLALDDERTFKLVSAARTIGVFQLESSGITEMVARMKPTCFEDLVAILALYRPGPLDAGMVDHYINRKHGREPVTYLHPILEPVLKDTYGIMLYQEQIMQIARDMAGYSLGDADLLRRAMGKKKPEEMAKQRKIFLKGSVERGIDEKIANEVFDQMETFARYGFNRSHSVAYALISYQTAYLKAHFPKQFMAALMTLEMGDTDKTLKNLNECKEIGITVVPPDVNNGLTGFNVSKGKIVFGLAAIKGIGKKAVEPIVEERTANGEYKSLLDFCMRLDSSVLNRRLVENLVRSGAFDWTELPRAEMMERIEEVLKYAQQRKEELASPQMGLFGSAEENKTDVYQPNRALLSEWPQSIKLAQEKEALGFYLSGHPLTKFRRDLQRLGTAPTDELRRRSDGSSVVAGGVITFLKLKNTKKGDRYASFILEDLNGTVEVLVWPDVYRKVYGVLSDDDPVLIKGRIDVSDERCNLIANEVESLIALRDRTAREAVIRLPTSTASDDKLEELKTIFGQHKGSCPVKLVLYKDRHSETVVSLPDSIQVEPSELLCNQVEELFGAPVMSFR